MKGDYPVETRRDTVNRVPTSYDMRLGDNRQV